MRAMERKDFFVTQAASEVKLQDTTLHLWSGII
jgi:hypothetical protein